MDISLDIEVSEMKFLIEVMNNHMQGTVSHIFYIGLCFFMSKNG